MQRHSDIEVEGIVVDHTDSEEHGHHDHIVAHWNSRFLSSKIRLEDEPLQCNEGKLSEGHNVATSWKLSYK